MITLKKAGYSEAELNLLYELVHDNLKEIGDSEFCLKFSYHACDECPYKHLCQDLYNVLKYLSFKTEDK